MTVEHEPERGRFVTYLPAGEAVLRYAPAGDRVLDYYSTFVPPAARGQGVGEALVRAAVGYARAEGYRIVPSCWYVRDWLDVHPEARDLIAAS